MKDTGLNIPKVVEITKIEDRWAIVSDYIPGRTLDRLMKENPDKADEYLNLFVDLQLEMHSKKVPCSTVCAKR